jgi:hypothetical protein
MDAALRTNATCDQLVTNCHRGDAPAAAPLFSLPMSQAAATHTTEAGAPPAAADSPGRPWTERVADAIGAAAPALSGYLAVRLFGLLVLAALADGANKSLPALLGRYDAVWYLGIATDGYDTSVTYDADGRLAMTNIAFFPLFPALVRTVSAIGIPPLYAGLLVAGLAGLAAAWGIYAVGTRLHSSQLGTVLAIVWGALPHAIVQNMVYTETLFTAACAWAIWAVLTGRWVLAGGLTIAAGLTRPTAVALVGAVGLAALVTIVRRRDGWRPWVAAVLAPLGVLGYWTWCAVALGRPDAWFWMQHEAWRSELDFGRTTVEMVRATVTTPQPFAIYLTTIVLGLAVMLAAVLVLDRRWPLVVVAFGVAMIAVVALEGGGYYHAKARFLLPAFVLLIPVAMALVKASRTTRYVVLVTMAGLSAWYGGYLMLVWTRSP